MLNHGRRHLFLLLVLLLGTLSPARAQEASVAEAYYDIPAGPLAEALAAAATRAGIGLAFEPTVVYGRRSTAVRGRYSPQRLLAEMLNGTGLVARFTDRTSAIIFDPSSPAAAAAAERIMRASDRPTMDLDPALVRGERMIGRRDMRAMQTYARRAETEIQALFAKAPAYQGKAFTLRIAVTIAGDGRIAAARLERPSAIPEFDARIEETIVGRLLEAPPPDLPQPLRFDIAGTAYAGDRRRER